MKTKGDIFCPTLWSFTIIICLCIWYVLKLSAIFCHLLFITDSNKLIIFSVLFMPYNNSFIDQAISVKMAGYLPRSLFVFLWTSTLSRSIKTQKENLANIETS